MPFTFLFYILHKEHLFSFCNSTKHSLNIINYVYHHIEIVHSTAKVPRNPSIALNNPACSLASVMRPCI